jgi:hypothetical protein
MRSARLLLALACASLLAAPAVHAQTALKLPRPSQRAEVTQTIGTTDLKVVYHRPGVKGRAIWGALVPYDQPWRTGANEATQFTTSTDIQVGGTTVPAGTYAVVTIPGKDQWTMVISRQKELWGAFGYKPEEDVARVQVTPSAAPHQEWMAMAIEPIGADGAELVVHWEKLRVAMPIKVAVTDMVLKEARAAIAAAKADDWRTPMGAANWCQEAGVNLDEAKGWAAKAVAAGKNPRTLATSARVHAKAGDGRTALSHMTEAVALAKADDKFNKDLLATYEKDLTEWSKKK